MAMVWTEPRLICESCGDVNETGDESRPCPNCDRAAYWEWLDEQDFGPAETPEEVGQDG